MRAHGVVGLLGLLALGGAAGCFSERTAAGPSASVAAVPCAVADVQALGGAGKAVIYIKDFAFHPDTLRVRPGTTVVWVNCGFHCTPHPFMKGQIAVDASAPDVAGATGR